MYLRRGYNISRASPKNCPAQPHQGVAADNISQSWCRWFGRTVVPFHLCIKNLPCGLAVMFHHLCVRHHCKLVSTLNRGTSSGRWFFSDSAFISLYMLLQKLCQLVEPRIIDRNIDPTGLPKLSATAFLKFALTSLICSRIISLLPIGIASGRAEVLDQNSLSSSCIAFAISFCLCISWMKGANVPSE